jgi:hypothetical protein
MPASRGRNPISPLSVPLIAEMAPLSRVLYINHHIGDNQEPLDMYFTVLAAMGMQSRGSRRGTVFGFVVSDSLSAVYE